ncbi:MAG: Gfo/Idh/MocA family oxidoreductase, partial [Planctomycetes bacterium]|nr:Gfo/Idh/MocA family oxidoreductase [Planctomycetota bacterium]
MNKPIARRFDRRRFLKRTAAAVGAAAAPYVITSTALGAEGKPPASERVVTAGIGVGPRGLLNVREQLGCPDAQVVAICDVWKQVRERAKQAVDAHYKNTDCKAYTDFRELLARDDIGAVTIGSPDHWHVAMTIAAAKAG